MPTITRYSADESRRAPPAVMLSENVQPEDLANNHHAAQLVERLGWAVTDAKEDEETR